MRDGAFLRGMSRAFGWSRPVGDPAAGARPHGAGEGSTQSDANLWRETLDMLPQGIVLLDPAGRYIFWNQRYADIYSGSADLFKVGVRLEDTLRIGIARGEYPEAAGREEAWLGERMERMRNPAGDQRVGSAARCASFGSTSSRSAASVLTRRSSGARLASAVPSAARSVPNARAKCGSAKSRR